MKVRGKNKIKKGGVAGGSGKTPTVANVNRIQNVANVSRM